MRFAARSTVIAGVLAATAIAAPAASARPFDLALSWADSGRAQSQTTSPPSVVRPDQWALQPADAGTPPILRPPRASEPGAIGRAQAQQAKAGSYSPPATARYSSTALNGRVASPTNGRPSVLHVATHSNPFDWGAAAIGAAGGLVISLLIIGGGVLLTQHHHPKPRRTKALA